MGVVLDQNTTELISWSVLAGAVGTNVISRYLVRVRGRGDEHSVTVIARNEIPVAAMSLTYLVE